MRYYIQNQLEEVVEITADPFMLEFLILEADIKEHIQAQLDYIRDNHPEHNIQAIAIGVTKEKFDAVLDHLCSMYRGFKRMFYANRNVIPIRLEPQGNDLIRIINSDKL